MKEKELIDKIVKKLKKEGFEVETQPMLKENVRPDIIATKDDRKLIIEVKMGTAPGIKNILQTKFYQKAVNADESYIVSPLVASGSTVIIANQEHVDIVDSKKLKEIKF